MSLEVEIVGGVSVLGAKEWDALTDGSPILSHAFLSALEQTGCVGAGTGWQPYPITVRDNGKLVGATPLYLKGHSYGEYVFDWAWADAYQRNGIAYYPKMLIAIPFTPITGPRLLGVDAMIQALLAKAFNQQINQHSFSSAHILFPDEPTAEVLRECGWLERKGVQFRWENENFADFEDFLSRLSHDKRKKIRQERKKIAAAGVVCKRLTGSEASQTDWDFFFRCYENTYHQHHSTPYLTREFFYAIGARLPQQTLLIIAEQDGVPIAAALNLYSDQVLYGRYWGALRYVPGLHFELCYYQAQEFCIAHRIRYFEGGAQGEHKLARGFRPRPTCSFHKISHPEFQAAIENFLQYEGRGISAYHNELEERVPFKSL